MNKDVNKLKVDLASIVNLKAELLKKQEEFRLKKLSKSESTISEEYQTNKASSSTWGKKKISETKNVAEKAKEENAELSEVEVEEDAFQKSRKMLESKAKYYEELTSGKQIPEEGDEEIFLVNFDQKIVETKVVEEEQNNQLKLKKEVSEEEYNEQLRLKWEQEKLANLEKSSVHYQDIRFDEIRNLGVGNFRFSTDETERQKQMEFFKTLQSQTKVNRITNELYNLRKERVLMERLSKIKQKRLLKHGYSLDEIKELNEFEKQIGEIDEEILVYENLAENPEADLRRKDEEEEKEEDELTKLRNKRRMKITREWDKPKKKEKMWEKHMEKLRAERQKQFAPPQIYAESDGKKKKKSKKKIPNSEETEDTEEKSGKRKFSSESQAKREYTYSNIYSQMPPPPAFFAFPPFMFAQPPPPNFAFPPPPPQFPAFHLFNNQQQPK